MIYIYIYTTVTDIFETHCQSFTMFLMSTYFTNKTIANTGTSFNRQAHTT